MEIYKKIIKPGHLCYDIGANNGNKTQEMLNLGAKVVCLEPQISCCNNLTNKFKNNSNVTILQKAVGASVGSGKIFIPQAHTLSSMSEEFINETKKSRFSDVNWVNSQYVEITTLDDLILSYGIPFFCKIDVEGYEVEVLKGLSKPIPYISVEFTPELKKLTFECIELLSKLSDCKFNYSEAETSVFSFDNWLEKDEMIEFLLKNNDYVKSFGDLYIKTI